MILHNPVPYAGSPANRLSAGWHHRVYLDDPAAAAMEVLQQLLFGFLLSAEYFWRGLCSDAVHPVEIKFSAPAVPEFAIPAIRADFAELRQHRRGFAVK